MLPRRPHHTPPPARRRRALLVLGLLAGLLGMHALGPAMAAPPRAHEQHRMTVAATAKEHCHGAGDCGGTGHVHHADATCASGALDGPAGPPALAPSPLSSERAADAAGAGEPARQDGGRAPPSLAELQLLRI